MQSILRWAKKSNPSVIICSSVGYPVFMHPTKIERKVLEDSAIFDSIFIHTPPGEYTYVRRALGGDNLAAAERIMEGLRAKITYTNYIIKEKSWNTEENRTSIRDSLGLSGEKLVVSSRGGGAVSPKIIMDSILSMRRVGGCFMLACAGPSSSQREMDVFNRASAMANNVKVIGYTPSLERYIDACDVSIGLSGYNTSLEVLRSSKRSVLIPRANVEQSYRALMLKEMIGSSVIEHNRCSPEEIAREIGFQISRDPEVIPKTDPSMFNGIEVLGKGLRELKP
jgi:predicted glycosyltransferase